MPLMQNIKILRTSLLNDYDIESCRRIISFFSDPQNDLIISICDQVKNNRNSLMVKDVLENLISIFQTDRSLYFANIIYGQKIVWDEIVICFEAILEINMKFEQQQIVIYHDSYLKSCEEIKRICSYYIKSQAAISKLEDALGVDRYLDRVSEEDFAPLEILVHGQKARLESMCSEYKDCFQKNWSNAVLPEIIKHKLIQYNGTNQVSSLLKSKQERVLMFIIDGLGLCQYLWQKEQKRGEKTFTYKENIFSWLESVNSCKELLLGSSFITDTAAGLAQIFTGMPSRETGIISSKLLRAGDVNFTETKRITGAIFEQIFDTSTNSITDVVRTLGMKSKVFYCSKYSYGDQGFSRYIFKNANVESVVPQERVFSVLKDYLKNDDSKGLGIIYLTGIDNSGHTMGAYSKFERFEHEKLNGLFRNFMIELASDSPNLFDGSTSILVTADHGMAESARIMANRYGILDILREASISGVKLVEDNRALLLYDISENNLSRAKEKLQKYFEYLKIQIDILTNQEERYKEFFSIDNSKIEKNMPSIIIRMISNGLFYSASTNPHLLHYGGHGGASVGEVFVPLLDITLDQNLLSRLRSRFLNIM